PPRAGTRRQYQRAQSRLSEVSEGAGGARRAPLARRTRPTHLRQHLSRGLETLGRAHEDDSQRVPPHAVAERSPGTRCQTYGRILLRRRRGLTARVRASTGKIGANNRTKRVIAPAGYNRRTP